MSFLGTLGNIGMGIANAATGGAMGMLFAGEQDRRQVKQQEKLQALQIRGQKEMTDYNTAKQMEMWKNTNYPAQLAMMKQAGLSPALMYGGAGAGGATAQISQGNVNGADAPKGGNEMVQMGMMQQQLQLTQAQKENIEADTAKKKVEADKMAGIDTQVGQQTVESEKTKQELNKLELRFKNETYKADVQTVKYETDIALQQLETLRTQNLINDATWSTKIDLIQNEGAMMLLKNSILANEKRLQESQMEEIAQRIKASVKQLEQGDRALDQKDKDILIDQERNKLIETGIWVGGATQVIGNIVDIFKKRPAGGMGGKK